jgi:hypothetical protein
MKNFEFLEDKLNKKSNKPNKSLFSIAKHVSKNEARKIYNELKRNKKINPEKIRELKARILGLDISKIPTLSPFNPPEGFYIWNISDNGYISLETLGRNVKEVVFNIMKFILEKN